MPNAAPTVRGIRLGLSVVRATYRARRAPRLHVSSIEGRQLLGKRGAES